MSAISRRPWYLVWLGLGAALLLLSALPVHADSISALEGDAFRRPGQPRRPHQATA
jgi:hypothetical protein